MQNIRKYTISGKQTEETGNTVERVETIKNAEPAKIAETEEHNC